MASKKNEKYTQILEGAVKVFARHGFFRSQVSKIAKEAGVADGTIYLYFKNKEEILIKIFEFKLGKLVERFQSSIGKADNAKEAIREICTIHYSQMEEDVDFAYVAQIELRQSSLELRKAIGQTIKPYIQLIESILMRGIEENVFRSDMNVKLVRLLLFGAMDEVITSWLISGRKYSLMEQIDGTVDFFLRGIRS
ncbi:TetR/AcrR family transcriptional regulator [Ferviditalea candida]|uniref:TetR/AcrR family transcriptional regulator n=1 Tax=Ferviditalea candida TaxID=3108399 RepID=A0ABU5ZHD2_9BACL|nr:TetR/AcrR family transcriptional regulator [Paenibacillaceae bacterium T2]